MAKGISLHLGLNRVNPRKYDGWAGELAGCIPDAKDMQTLAKGRGFKTTLLTDNQATSTAVKQAIKAAATKLKAGDFFFFTYSGHGGQVPDKNKDEEDRLDETLCLYDREFVDDELAALWALFRPGVRVLMLSDSCHSGTQLRMVERATVSRSMASPTSHIRALPKEVGDRVYRKNRKLYDGIQKTHRAGDEIAIGATVFLISGCQDNQVSADGDKNGLFTENLKAVWKNGKFKGNYKSFHKAIQRRMPSYQSPNFYVVGATNAEFEAQTPFTL